MRQYRDFLGQNSKSRTDFDDLICLIELSRGNDSIRDRAASEKILPARFRRPHPRNRKRRSRSRRRPRIT